MFKYAQLYNGKVAGLSELHSEVIHGDLIALDENGLYNGQPVSLGDNFDGVTFTTPEQGQ